MVEDRLVGIKSREVYEAPGAIALITAHQELENVTVERDLARFKRDRRPALGRAGLRRPVVLAAQARAGRLHRRGAAARHRRGPADAARRPGRRRPAGAATQRSTTTTSRRTTPATPSTRRWPRASSSCGACRARSPRRATRRRRPTGIAGDRHAGRTPGSRGCGAGGSPAARPRRWPAVGVSVHFDWRLAPYDLAGSRAHARVLHRAGLLDDDELGAMLAALDDLDADGRATATFRPTVDDEDVHTALERGLLERLGAARRQAARRPQPQRPGRHRPAALPARRRPGRSPRAVAELRDRAGRPGRAAPRHAPMPGHDPPAARAAGAARPPPAGARACVRARRRAAARLGRRAARCARSAPARWPGRRCRSTRPRSRAELGFDARPRPTRSTRCPTATSSPSSCSSPRCSACTCRGSARRSACGRPREFGWVELADALRDRVVDHAAEEEPGRRRAGPRQVRPADRQPDRRCSRPSRACRSPTTATCRRTRSRSSTRSSSCCWCCPRWPAWSRRCGSTPSGWPRPRPQGFALATDVAEWLVRTGVPFREAHEVAGALVRAAARTHGMRAAATSTDDDWPRSTRG